MKHLDDINETYWQHFRFAFNTGLVFIFTGVLILIHAIIPQIFQTTGSDVTEHLYKILKERREKND